MADAAVEEEFDGQDIFYVCKRALESAKEILKKGEDVKEELVNELTLPEKLKDDEVMVPVDMRGVGEAFADVEAMMEKLGPKGTAEAFIKAKDYFDANKDKEPEDERPKPMTAAEWRQVLEEDVDLLEGEEEMPFEGEEEELLDEGEEEEDGGDPQEPAAKKAKSA